MAAAGHDVAFIARGAHRDAIRLNGLKIESALGDLHLKDVNVTNDPTQVGPVDVVLFAVKLWDTETAGEQTCPLLGPDSRVITLQNGVESVDRLAPILGEEATIAGTTYVVATIAKPGVIHHTGTTARIHCGRLDRRPDRIAFRSRSCLATAHTARCARLSSIRSGSPTPTAPRAWATRTRQDENGTAVHAILEREIAELFGGEEADEIEPIWRKAWWALHMAAAAVPQCSLYRRSTWRYGTSRQSARAFRSGIYSADLMREYPATPAVSISISALTSCCGKPTTISPRDFAPSR
jgi:hypothetical protein